MRAVTIAFLGVFAITAASAGAMPSGKAQSENPVVKVQDKKDAKKKKSEPFKPQEKVGY